MPKLLRAILFCATTLVVTSGLAPLLGPVRGLAQQLRIIANPSVNLTTPLTLDEVAAIYLLRATVWPDGSHIIPVNREATSPIRTAFTATVLGQDEASLAAYWNEMHFLGRQPPVVQESEQAVIAFVAGVPGAVGYIGGVTPAPGVRVLADVP